MNFLIEMTALITRVIFELMLAYSIVWIWNAIKRGIEFRVQVETIEDTPPPHMVTEVMDEAREILSDASRMIGD